MASQDSCNICGGKELDPWKSRSDGVRILRCGQCGMGIVERLPPDIDAIYEADSYYASTEQGVGYSDYSKTAEHSTAWAASLTRLLAPSGRVLDIGCADGHLLKKLAKPCECFGIEMNRKMAMICEGQGITVIANSIYEAHLKQQYQEAFDVVLAVAVLEHVPDLAEAVKVALGMLRPQGVLIFEVPLMSVEHSDDVWLRSSLEHIYYPSETSLHYLFETVFKQTLVGSEIVINDYGSTYIGIVSKDQQRAEEVRNLFQRVVLGPMKDLSSRPEVCCRLLISVVHAGQTEPDLLARLEQLTPGEANLLLLQRLWSLWIRDRERLDSTTCYLRDVEEARNWHADRAQEIMADLQRTIAIAAERERLASGNSSQEDSPTGKGKAG